MSELVWFAAMVLAAVLVLAAISKANRAAFDELAVYLSATLSLDSTQSIRLARAVVVAELAIAGMIVFPRSQGIGLFAAALLLGTYAAVGHRRRRVAESHVPCACFGRLSSGRTYAHIRNPLLFAMAAGTWFGALDDRAEGVQPRDRVLLVILALCLAIFIAASDMLLSLLRSPAQTRG